MERKTMETKLSEAGKLFMIANCFLYQVMGGLEELAQKLTKPSILKRLNTWSNEHDVLVGNAIELEGYPLQRENIDFEFSKLNALMDEQYENYYKIDELVLLGNQDEDSDRLERLYLGYVYLISYTISEYLKIMEQPPILNSEYYEDFLNILEYVNELVDKLKGEINDNLSISDQSQTSLEASALKWAKSWTKTVKYVSRNLP